MRVIWWNTLPSVYLETILWKELFCRDKNNEKNVKPLGQGEERIFGKVRNLHNCRQFKSAQMLSSIQDIHKWSGFIAILIRKYLYVSKYFQYGSKTFLNYFVRLSADFGKFS